MKYAIAPLGDSALTITFGNAISDETSDRILSLFSLLRKKSIAGVIDIIPAYTTLTIVYDVILIKSSSDASAYDNICNQVNEIIKLPIIEKSGAGETLEIPVCYDLSLGIDLIEMSRNKNLAVDEIIKLHTSKTYRVFMIGFLPGFAYMGKVDKTLSTPRKAVPEINIAAGSVGIAGDQTGIYPLNSPGGWNIIGRTPLRLFKATQDYPCLFYPGNKVKFYAITLIEFNKIKQEQWG